MRRFICAALGAALLSGCVSTQMKQYVGQDITEAIMRYGQPANVISLPDGRRAFQFEQGGGARVVPGTQRATATNYRNQTTVTGSYTPATIAAIKPCLLTFIAEPAANSWRIVAMRVPKELVC